MVDPAPPKTPVAMGAPDWLLQHPPPRSLPLDQDALGVFERAYYIGAALESDSGSPPVSFTVLLLALLSGEPSRLPPAGWRPQAHPGDKSSGASASRTIRLEALPNWRSEAQGCAVSRRDSRGPEPTPPR